MWKWERTKPLVLGQWNNIHASDMIIMSTYFKEMFTDPALWLCEFNSFLNYVENKQMKY